MLLLTNMTNKLPATVLLLGSLLLAPRARAQKLSADGAMQTFNYLSEQFFSQVYFKFSPTGGTAAGLHQYDAQLEDYSAAAVAREVAADFRLGVLRYCRTSAACQGDMRRSVEAGCGEAQTTYTQASQGQAGSRREHHAFVRTDGFQPEIARGRIRRLPQFHRARSVLRRHANRAVLFHFPGKLRQLCPRQNRVIAGGEGFQRIGAAQ